MSPRSPELTRHRIKPFAWPQATIADTLRLAENRPARLSASGASPVALQAPSGTLDPFLFLLMDSSLSRGILPHLSVQEDREAQD